MSTSYTYNPNAWHPVLAGAVAGAIAAMVAALVSLPLRSPDEVVANTVTIVVVSIALGLLAGGLWRRLRATENAEKVFVWTLVGAFFVSMAAIALTDLFALDNTAKYATPLAVIIFVTLGFFVPMLSRVTAPLWVAAIPIVVALALGIGLFGRGNVVSGELSLDDLDGSTEQGVVASGSGSASGDELSGAVSVPQDLAVAYAVTEGIATYTVDEVLQGLTAQAVGSTDSVAGSAAPGGAFSFEIDLQSFTSDQSRRDGKVRDWFSANPTGSFANGSFDLPSSAVVGEAITLSVPGSMTINAIDNDVTWAVEARLESNGTLSIQGETDIVLSDFNIPVTDSSFVTMEDGAHLEVLLSLASTSNS